MCCLFGQFRGAKACLCGTGKLWCITFHSLHLFLGKGLIGMLIAVVLFFPAMALDLVGTVLGVSLAVVIGVLELIFAILIRQ